MRNFFDLDFNVFVDHLSSVEPCIFTFVNAEFPDSRVKRDWKVCSVLEAEVETAMQVGKIQRLLHHISIL